MATVDHTPVGRGYNSSLHYFEHMNDYWTQRAVQVSARILCGAYGAFSTFPYS